MAESESFYEKSLIASLATGVAGLVSVQRVFS